MTLAQAQVAAVPALMKWRRLRKQVKGKSAVEQKLQRETQKARVRLQTIADRLIEHQDDQRKGLEGR